MAPGVVVALGAVAAPGAVVASGAVVALGAVAAFWAAETRAAAAMPGVSWPPLSSYLARRQLRIHTYAYVHLHM